MTQLYKFVPVMAVAAFAVFSFSGCCGNNAAPQPFQQSTCSTCSGAVQGGSYSTPQYGTPQYASPQYSTSPGFSQSTGISQGSGFSQSSGFSQGGGFSQGSGTISSPGSFGGAIGGGSGSR